VGFSTNSWRLFNCTEFLPFTHQEEVLGVVSGIEKIIHLPPSVLVLFIWVIKLVKQETSEEICSENLIRRDHIGSRTDSSFAQKLALEAYLPNLVRI
jgi:hypothetical protein